MARRTTLEMRDWERQPIIAKHEFYVEQACARLLSQFENKNADADRAGHKWLEQNEHHFDPDRHDPGDFYERAYDITIYFYQSLSDMHEQTRLSVVAGMFHQWDKQLREWITREISHWGRLKNFTDEVWAAPFDDLMDLLAAFGWNVRTLKCSDRLDACRWVVNAYKHGEGKALDRLRREYPRFLLQSFPQEIDYVPDPVHRSHENITVTEDDIIDFSAAIVEFWQAVPEVLVVAAEEEDLTLPPRFERAFNKDYPAG